MPVANQNGIGALDVCCLEPKRWVNAAAIIVRIQQQNMAIIDQFEVRIADPSNCERMRIAGQYAAGCGQCARLASLIARLGGGGLIDRFISFRAGINKRARLPVRGKHRERKNCEAGIQNAVRVHESSPRAGRLGPRWAIAHQTHAERLHALECFLQRSDLCRYCLQSPASRSPASPR